MSNPCYHDGTELAARNKGCEDLDERSEDASSGMGSLAPNVNVNAVEVVGRES